MYQTVHYRNSSSGLNSSKRKQIAVLVSNVILNEMSTKSVFPYEKRR